MRYFNNKQSIKTESHFAGLRSNIAGLAKLKHTSQNRQDEVEQAGLRLTQRLQRTLDIQELLQLFCQEIANLVPCNSTSYQNIEENLGYTYGTHGVHVCQYKLELEGMYLGELVCTRDKAFGDQDLLVVETLAGSLVYPLRNALMYRQAINMALQDPLTGAGNRKALDKALSREQNMAERYDTPFSMLIIDIDFFKNINDDYGHSCGDTTLKAVSKTIQQTIRQSDDMFRYGGEEFVVLLNNCDVNNASIMAERIRQAIEKVEILCKTGVINVTVSIGVANFNKQENMDNLFNRADQALYKAKDGGRNQVTVAA